MWDDAAVDPRYQGYLDGLRARRAARDAEDSARTARARALLPEAARILREDFGATRVGAFGSLVTSGLAPESDIDLYVDALPRGSYWRAVARLATLFGRPVDLVELCDASPSLCATIAEDGVDVA